MSTETKALAQRLDMGALIQQAVEHGSGVETLERLLAMAKDLRAEQARSAWYDAMARFQAEAPVIVKSKTAKVTTRTGGSYSYTYAPLEDLIAKMRPILSSHGLSVVFKTTVTKTHVMARADVAHQDGHVEGCEFTIPIDLEAKMNVAQQVGSACTYARRYAYLAALGLSPEDDDDGAAASAGKATEVEDERFRSQKQRTIDAEQVKAQGSTDAEANRGAPVWRGKLVDVEIKQGKKQNNDPYTAFIYKGFDGVKFGTFSETIAKDLEKMVKDGRFVEIVFSENSRGKKVEEWRDVTDEEVPI